MRTQQAKGGSAVRPARAAGFTLIELLTVVAIIGLLVGMVVPTIRSVIQAQADVVTKARITNLDNAAKMYKMAETGNRYFPGQQYLPEQIEGKYQGRASVFLARCLFTDWKSNRDPKPFPISGYAQYDAEMLDDPEGTETGEPYTILDRPANPMAILYFVSKAKSDASLKGEPEQFDQSHNTRYYDAGENVDANSSVVKFADYGGDDDGGGQDTVVRNDGSFLLIAPGRDRLYFNGDDKHNSVE